MILLSHTLRSRKHMKSNSIRGSHMTLSIVLVDSLFFILLLSGTAASKIEPAGTDAGAVRFDAVIELNRFSSRSLRHTHTLMFARYWVASDYYSAAVVWAEPQSTDLYFTVPPATLSVTSDEQGFNMHHEVYTKYNDTYKKPIGERGVFRDKFGGYPIGNIRFAEQEASATRIYAADLGDLEDADQVAGEVLDLSIPVTEGGDTRDVAQLKVQTSGERIDSMELFNAKHQLLKSISYEYDSKGGKTRLRRQTAVLPERPLMVGFRGKGLKVTLDGKEYRYLDLEVPHHRGGRRCTVEYEPVPLGDKEVPLPVHVTVCSGRNERILRSVRMMNFKQVELDAAGAEQAARQFGGFTGEQHKYREFLSKYWKKDPTEVEKADVEAIKQLRARFEKAVDLTDSSAGESLKHLNILMELDRIVGDQSELERHYQSYLSTLGENKLFQMTLVGGYGVIETAMFWGRHAEAAKLLARWVDAVLVINDAESILPFARSQLAKKRFWTTAKLLEAFSNKRHFLADARFEAEALRCAALHELWKLLRTNDVAKKGLIAKVQTDWVASIGKDNLETMLADSVGEARRSFAGLLEPTESQQALKKQLDEIDQEIKQAKNQ